MGGVIDAFGAGRFKGIPYMSSDSAIRASDEEKNGPDNRDDDNHQQGDPVEVEVAARAGEAGRGDDIDEHQG
jgi:hypothetical protein